MNSKEIGGFFEVEKHFSNKGEYYRNLLRLNNGRNALFYIIRSRGIKKIYIPSFLCDSIVNMCLKYEIKYEEYPINDCFLPVFDRKLGLHEYLLIVNYYGQIGDEQIYMLKEKYKNIIVDNTQAFFSKPIKNIDTFYSCRKFFGIPDGSYLFTTSFLKTKLEKDCSDERMTHIIGRSNKSAFAYYDDYRNNEEVIGDLSLKEMSSQTRSILEKLDYDKIISIRNSNFSYLHNSLFSYNKLTKLQCPVGPFCYPFYVDNGEILKKILIKNKIYVPTLWPYALLHGGLDSDYAMNIIPIPCDQRYDHKDMDRIIKVIAEYFNSLHK